MDDLRPFITEQLSAFGVPGAGVCVVREGEVVVADGWDHTVLCRVPEDIVAVRESDTGLAAAWREALNLTLGRVMSEAGRVRDFDREGWYVVERT